MLMNRKTLLLLLPLVILGVALLVEGSWSLFSLKNIIDQGTSEAKKLDHTSPNPSGSVCKATPDATLAQRVMSESDTVALTISISNSGTPSASNPTSDSRFVSNVRRSGQTAVPNTGDNQPA